MGQLAMTESNVTFALQDVDWRRLVALAIVAALGGGALVGLFKTKQQGFGRYKKSVLIVILALSFGTVALMARLIREQAFVSFLMTVTGFAGGMVVGKEDGRRHDAARKNDP